MYRVILLLVAAVLLNLFSSPIVNAGLFGSDRKLVTINGIAYEPDDFRHWWENWHEKGSKFPGDPQQFIEWKLLAVEAKSMELDQQQNYQRKIDVFYKVRTRIQLKYDTVDSKIQISEEDIARRYRDDYSPIWEVSLLYFDTLPEAQKVYQDLANNKFSLSDLKLKAGTAGGPVVKEGKFRPINLQANQELLELLRSLSVGQISSPQQLGNYFVLLRIEEKSFPEKSELKMKEQTIREKLWKENQAILTKNLIDDLWKKFEVSVDEDLLPLVYSDLDKKTLTKPIVETNRENIPLWILVGDINKEKKLRRDKNWSEKEKKEIAQGFLNGIIADYLLTWEAEDRHYEETPPFKWTYQFYKENRLIKELEALLVAPQVKVSDAEIKEYYESNPDEFRPPDIITVDLVTGDEDAIRAVSAEIVNGQNITQAAEKFNITPNTIIDIPVSQISPKVVEAVNNLSIGQVSLPFEMYGKYNLAKLVNRKIKEPAPLKNVSKDISKRLSRTKFQVKRQEYVDALLEQSEIKVNKKNWQKLQAEYQD